MTKKLCLYNRLFVTNQNFTTVHIKIGIIPGFLFEIPGFSGYTKPQNPRF